jgi:hypothetical protein
MSEATLVATAAQQSLHAILPMILVQRVDYLGAQISIFKLIGSEPGFIIIPTLCLNILLVEHQWIALIEIWIRSLIHIKHLPWALVTSTMDLIFM